MRKEIAMAAALCCVLNVQAEEKMNKFKQAYTAKETIECGNFYPEIKAEMLGSVLKVSVTNRHKDLTILSNTWDKSNMFLSIDIGINYRLAIAEDPRSSQAIEPQGTQATEHIPFKKGVVPSKPSWEIYEGNWSKWKKNKTIYKEIDLSEAMKTTKRWESTTIWRWPESDFGWTKPMEKSDKKPVAGKPWLVSVNAFFVAKECTSLIFNVGNHSIIFPDLSGK